MSIYITSKSFLKLLSNLSLSILSLLSLYNHSSAVIHYKFVFIFKNVTEMESYHLYSFSVWLLSLSMIILRFTHVFKCVCSSFLQHSSLQALTDLTSPGCLLCLHSRKLQGSSSRCCVLETLSWKYPGSHVARLVCFPVS